MTPSRHKREDFAATHKLISERPRLNQTFCDGRHGATKAVMPNVAAWNGRTRKDPSLYCAQPRAPAERKPARLHVHCRLESCCGPLMGVTTEKAERGSTREPKSGFECARRATLRLPRWMFGGWGYRSRWFNRTRPVGQRKHTAAMNAKNVEQHA